MADSKVSALTSGSPFALTDIVYVVKGGTLSRRGTVGDLALSGLQVPLTGYSTGSNVPVVSTDTLLTAVGKLQAQVSTSSGGTTTEIPFNATLNLSGQYTYPDTVGTSGLTLLKPATLTPGASLGFNLIGNGTNDVAFGPDIKFSGDAYDRTSGSVNNMLAGVNAGYVFINNRVIGVPSAITSAIIANATPNKIVFTVTGTLVTAPAASDITLGSAGGRTVTSLVYSGNTFTATVSSNFTSSDAPTYSIAAGKFSTATGTNGAIVNASVTNGVLPARRADNFTSSDLTASDGGSPWVVESGTYNKLTSPACFGRPTGTALVVALELGTLFMDQTLTIVPAFLAGSGGVSFFVRQADANNLILVTVSEAQGRINLFVLANGTSVKNTNVDNVLTAAANNTVRMYFTSLNDFKIDINGVNYPSLNFTITDSYPSLRTNTKLKLSLGTNEPQITKVTNLA